MERAFFFPSGGGGCSLANSSSLIFLWEDSKFSDTHGLVGGYLGKGADFSPLLHCSGPAAGLHLQLQQALLPHLSLLGNPTCTHAGQIASSRDVVDKVRMCGENMFASHQGSLVAVFTVTEAYFCPMFSKFAEAKPLQASQRAGFRVRHLYTAFPCGAVAKGQRVKRLVLKAFCSLGPKGSFVPRHQPS